MGVLKFSESVRGGSWVSEGFQTSKGKFSVQVVFGERVVGSIKLQRSLDNEHYSDFESGSKSWFKPEQACPVATVDGYVPGEWFKVVVVGGEPEGGSWVE